MHHHRAKAAREAQLPRREEGCLAPLQPVRSSSRRMPSSRLTPSTTAYHRDSESASVPRLGAGQSPSGSAGRSALAPTSRSRCAIACGPRIASCAPEENTSFRPPRPPSLTLRPPRTVRSPRCLAECTAFAAPLWLAGCPAAPRGSIARPPEPHPKLHGPRQLPGGPAPPRQRHPRLGARVPMGREEATRPGAAARPLCPPPARLPRAAGGEGGGAAPGQPRWHSARQSQQ